MTLTEIIKTLESGEVAQKDADSEYGTMEAVRRSPRE